MEELKPNVGKNSVIVVDGVSYERLPIRTHLITDQDNILDVAEKYGTPFLTEPDDILFISEKCVACTQKRAIPLADIKPRKLATWLSKHVTKTPHGIGLGMPETMECALREVGSLRILFAAAISVIDGSMPSRATAPAPLTARATIPSRPIITMSFSDR